MCCICVFGPCCRPASLGHSCIKLPWREIGVSNVTSVVLALSLATWLAIWRSQSEVWTGRADKQVNWEDENVSSGKPRKLECKMPFCRKAHTLSPLALAASEVKQHRTWRTRRETVLTQCYKHLNDRSSFFSRADRHRQTAMLVAYTHRLLAAYACNFANW